VNSSKTPRITSNLMMGTGIMNQSRPYRRRFLMMKRKGVKQRRQQTKHGVEWTRTGFLKCMYTRHISTIEPRFASEPESHLDTQMIGLNSAFNTTLGPFDPNEDFFFLLDF